MAEPPAMPRPAASLLLLRGGPSIGEPPEVLMGLRGAAHVFMPNRLVFPGGAVDPADADAPRATALKPTVHALLARSVGADLAPAFVSARVSALGIAAARELEEETGLSLGRPPALDGLDLLCRAITPDRSPIRFDAWFFVADAAGATGALAGSGELVELRWYGLAEALALDLAFPTRGVLDRLADWLAMPPDERAARQTLPTLVNREWSER